MDFPCGSTGKESPCKAGDLGLIPGLRRSPGERKDYPLQNTSAFWPGNSMDCTVHGVAKIQTWLSNFHFTFSSWSPLTLSYLLSSLYNSVDLWVFLAVENCFIIILGILFFVLCEWRCLEALVREGPKVRGRRLNSRTWEHQRTPDSMEH